MTTPLTNDLLKLLAEFDELYHKYETDNTPQDQPVGITIGKHRAYGHAAKKVRELLKWHGIIPGGMPTQS